MTDFRHTSDLRRPRVFVPAQASGRTSCRPRPADSPEPAAQDRPGRGADDAGRSRKVRSAAIATSISTSGGNRWVGPPRPRTAPDWRPFAGNLSARSAAYALSVLGALFRWLIEQRYVLANPFAGIKVRGRTRVAPLDTSHGFSEGERAAIQDTRNMRGITAAFGEHCPACGETVLAFSGEPDAVADAMVAWQDTMGGDAKIGMQSRAGEHLPFEGE
jgi:hypothetical protein